MTETEQTDATNARVRGIVLTSAADARGLLDRFLTLPEDRESTCRCGHGQSAHHGEDGELRCGERGCGCAAFAETDPAE